ncbi:MAG: aquaporin [Pseudonocardiales bacterium]|jgi:aquaporin Z|nr:aquaporin [Pseudonocardiales bacterium]
MTRRVVAEGIGTFVLVFFAVGSAVFGIDKIGPVGVALAFGLVLLALAYAIGPISGCHVNPAVTLGVLLSRGISAAHAGLYVVAQLVGAIVAGALLKLLVVAGGITDQTGGLGTNSWGKTVNLFGALVVEILLTALLVMVVLLVTHADATPGFAGLAIGLVLTVIHLVGIPLTGTSVNPARSIGPALFAGGDALGQLWLFIVAPLIGAVLAFGAVRGLLAGRAGELTAADERDPTGAV